MMGIGFPELMVILVIIMIIFGAGKLPEIGNAFGKSIKDHLNKYFYVLKCQITLILNMKRKLFQR